MEIVQFKTTVLITINTQSAIVKLLHGEVILG